MFLNYYNVLVLKIFLKNKYKNILFVYISMQNILKKQLVNIILNTASIKKKSH